MRKPQKPAEPAPDRRGDDAAKTDDPHGIGKANAAVDEKPAATPNADRHETETAFGDKA